MIVLKTPDEIEFMRLAGEVVADAHHLIEEMLAPGVTTAELDAAVESLFNERGATPLFKGYPGEVPFPAVSCISVNEEVVHGIPGERTICEGDIVSFDTGCRLNGWCADAAWTYPVGKMDAANADLLRVGEAALWSSINELSRQATWFDVARIVSQQVTRAGFCLIEDFVGHGIGREMHEDPQVPSVVDGEDAETDFALEPGLVVAIEPMVTAGTPDVVLCDDYWTVETEDFSPCVHFEHSIAMTDDGPVVLTAGVGRPCTTNQG
jgi:methionyl aminopeptidase